MIWIQRSDGQVRQVPAANAPHALRRFWTETTIYNGDSVIARDMFVVVGARVVDLSGIVAIEQALAVAKSELDRLAPDTAVAMISVPGGRRG